MELKPKKKMEKFDCSPHQYDKLNPAGTEIEQVEDGFSIRQTQYIEHFKPENRPLYSIPVSQAENALAKSFEARRFYHRRNYCSIDRNPFAPNRSKYVEFLSRALMRVEGGSHLALRYPKLNI